MNTDRRTWTLIVVLLIDMAANLLALKQMRDRESRWNQEAGTVAGQAELADQFDEHAVFGFARRV